MKIIALNTAGSPTNSEVKWTDLSPFDIAKLYEEQYTIKLSKRCIKRVLTVAGYKKRKPSKQLCTGKSPLRAEQFAIILMLTNLFKKQKRNPILSIDTKKKEILGNLTRQETILCKEAPLVYDHDYPNLATGKAIPHGIFDVQLNKGYVTIGDSHDTAEFIVENLLWWWDNFGIHEYPDATQILILCDGGGGNGSHHYAFKYELLKLAQCTGKEWIICHYPPYCSKWNPIEHAFFCHLHHSIKGAILTSHEQVAQLMRKTTAKAKDGKHLQTEVRVVHKHYAIKRKITGKDLDYSRIMTHSEMPRFNYMIKS